MTLAGMRRIRERLRASEVRKQIVVLLLSLLTAVAATLATDVADFGFGPALEILLGVGLFCAFLLVDLVWLTARNSELQIRDHETWRLRREVDADLTGMRDSFSQIVAISHGERDPFVNLLRKDIKDLARKIKDAAEKQELRATSDFVLNANGVFDAFLGDPQPVLRYVWPVEDGERLFNDFAWSRFFEVLADLVGGGTVKVRAILVFGTSDQAKQDRAQRLFDFFHTNPGQECRYIFSQTFAELCTENGIPSGYLDFGLYGDRLLFRSEKYKPVYIGLYSKDEESIERYSKFFDSIWDSAILRRNPSDANQKVTAEQLMRQDEDLPL